MKQTTLFLFVSTLIYMLINTMAFAQAPQTFPYQAVARDANGNLLANQNIALRFSILDISNVGPVLYQETQSASTNALGLFTKNIGQGTPVTGIFSAINWGSGSKYIKVEMDANNGNSYTVMGTSQLLSVPYAMYANNNLANGTAAGNTSYWNGSNWVVNSNTLFNNGTNIGIGTSTPNHKLTIANGDFFVQSNSASIGLGYESGNQWKVQTTNAGADMRWQSSTDGNTFTPRHYFSQNGNVGIGGGFISSVPQARLEVQGSSNTSVTNNLMLRSANGDTLLRMRDDGRMGIGYNGLSYGRTLTLGGTGINFYTPNETSFGGAIFPTDTSLVIWSNSGGSDNLILQPSWGGVGIGTNTANAKLEVNGTTILGTFGTPINEIIKATVTKDIASIAAGATNIETFSVPNAAYGSTVYISPNLPLANGTVIAFARVASTNVVEVRFTNITSSTINTGSMSYNITVIR